MSIKEEFKDWFESNSDYIEDYGAQSNDIDNLLDSIDQYHNKVISDLEERNRELQKKFKKHLEMIDVTLANLETAYDSDEPYYRANLRDLLKGINYQTGESIIPKYKGGDAT